MGKKFTDFVNKMDEEAKKYTQIDPTTRIERFRQWVDALYADVDTWLHEEIESDKIQTGIVPITIMEEALGAYRINEKWLQIGNARIQLRPIGTVLIGTDARVDLIYRSKNVMIVRVGENVDSPYDMISVEINGEKIKNKKKDAGQTVWKYVQDEFHLSYVTLDKDRFEDLIMGIVDGSI